MKRVLGPTVWMLEDGHRDCELMEQILGLAFQGLQFKPFRTIESFIEAMTTPGASDPDLVILDMLVPARLDGSGNREFPGLDALDEVRKASHHSVAAIVRSGFDQAVVGIVEDHSVLVVPKGEGPEAVVEAASTLLGVRGFERQQNVSSLQGVPIGQGPLWTGPGLVIGLAAVTGSLWVSAALQVTSSRSNGENAWLIVLGILGSACIGATRVVAGTLRWVALAAGLAAVLLAGLVLPV